MNSRQVDKIMTDLGATMDGSVKGVFDAATKAQKIIYDLILKQLNAMDVEGGRLVPTQDYAARLAVITRQMDEVLRRDFAPAVNRYLRTYDTIDEIAVKLARDYNQIKIDLGQLNPARKSIYRQAKTLLTAGLDPNYKDPVKYILAQAATSGMSIRQARKTLQNWDDGKMSTGQNLVTNQPSPRLSTYASHISRDAIFGYQGAEQELIKQTYGFSKFLYNGGIIGDSRTFCRLLVAERRKIGFNELNGFIKKAAEIDNKPWPDGMKPGTKESNFSVNRGGWECRHTVLAVR